MKKVKVVQVYIAVESEGFEDAISSLLTGSLKDFNHDSPILDWEYVNDMHTDLEVDDDFGLDSLGGR